ncbi:uncharacterized protein LOC128649926 isoform X1 [Bombina bombina]|uniref:uncharacterized protein LOC128649926 isoform X1 n=1 Tax=Bombina bombina TaxID=8345 RepID=UPI00235A50BE|nr:uncharacterized protein LOC128649926 isoform X1 [Bombina bombina]
MKPLRAALLFVTAINLFPGSNVSELKNATVQSTAGTKGTDAPISTSVQSIAGTNLQPSTTAKDDTEPKATGTTLQPSTNATDDQRKITESADKMLPTSINAIDVNKSQANEQGKTQSATQSSMQTAKTTFDVNKSPANEQGITQSTTQSRKTQFNVSKMDTEDSSHSDAAPTPDLNLKDVTLEPKNNDNNVANDNYLRSKKGIVTVVCILLAVIISIVIAVFLYKICQRKTPVVEQAGTKTSAQNKENVKLISVRTSATDSDLKRTSHSLQADMFAEC